LVLATEALPWRRGALTEAEGSTVEPQGLRVEVEESRSPVDGRLRFVTKRYTLPDGSRSHEEDYKPDGRLFKVTYYLGSGQPQRVVEQHFAVHPGVTCAISAYGVDPSGQAFERHSVYSAAGEPDVITCFYPHADAAPWRVITVNSRAKTYSDVRSRYDEQGREIWREVYDERGNLVESRDPLDDF
jgi:hypothetical protein